MPTYAVTAASGNFGRLVVEGLLDRGVPAGEIAAIVRSPQKVADVADRGVVVRHGDYDDPDGLVGALEGIDRLLLISGTDFGNRVVQHTNVVDAARAAGVDVIAYTSLLHAETGGNPVAAEHLGTEAALESSGIPHVLLRNGWYTEVFTDQLAAFLATGEIVGAAGTGRISAASRADYAEAATTALMSDHEGRRTVYEFGGPSFSLPELAETITQVTGKTVGYRDVSEQELVEHLVGAGVPPEFADMLAAIDVSIASGSLETDSTDLADLLGRAPTPLPEVVRRATEAL